MFGTIFTGIIFGVCGLIMIIIGITQLYSKEPVGFYSGVKPPETEQLTDVKAWNKKHGIMWIIYGLIIWACCVCGWILNDDLLALIPYSAGTIIPVFFMMAYHNKLIGEYAVKSKETITK